MPTPLDEMFYGSLSASDCEKVGMWGGCGVSCFVYQEGRCKNPEEIKEDEER